MDASAVKVTHEIELQTGFVSDNGHCHLVLALTPAILVRLFSTKIILHFDLQADVQIKRMKAFRQLSHFINPC